jgi:hypothetical protein
VDVDGDGTIDESEVSVETIVAAREDLLDEGEEGEEGEEGDEGVEPT